MSRDYRLYLDDIAQAADRVQDYIRDYSLDKFLADQKTIDAVIRNFEIIGEAVKKIPDDLRDKYTEIDWKAIAGFRDVLIHDYLNINPTRVWHTAVSDLPTLRTYVAKILVAEHDSDKDS